MWNNNAVSLVFYLSSLLSSQRLLLNFEDIFYKIIKRIGLMVFLHNYAYFLCSRTIKINFIVYLLPFLISVLVRVFVCNSLRTKLDSNVIKMSIYIHWILEFFSFFNQRMQSILVKKNNWKFLFKRLRKSFIWKAIVVLVFVGVLFIIVI